jgi:tripartite motif-containing protein 71
MDCRNQKGRCVMKKLFSVLAWMPFLGLGSWGCGHIQNPTAPLVKTSTETSTVPNPSYTTSWSKAGSVSFVNPQNVAVDPSNNVYVTDAYLGEVFKFDSNGNLLSQWGNTGASALSEPSGIVVENGNIYVADSSNDRIVEFDPNGNQLAQLCPVSSDGYDLFVYPTGISFDQSGNLYVADNSDQVYQFNSSLQLTAQWGTSGATNGIFNYPVVSVEDGSGNLYIVNNNIDNIVKFNPAVNSIATWGQTGNQNGQLEGPNDVKLDSNGNAYVVDTGNNRIEVFNANGTYQVQWGNISGSRGLNGPTGIALDSNGNAYVVDNGNNRIIKYSLNS